MSTRVTITIWNARDGAQLRERVTAAFGVFSSLEEKFSTFRPSSEISRLNKRAGTNTIVSEKFMETLLFALGLWRESGGFFDSWIKHGEGELFVLPTERLIRLPNGSILDLNAVVKGLAIDQALSCLPDGVTAMIEAGGDIAVKGRPPTGNTWRIGVRDPMSPRKIVTVVPLENGAICTSGEYFRGKHLRRTNSSSWTNEIASLTVLAPNAKLADGLSTAAFSMPISDALEFVEKFDNASALAVDHNGEVFMSPRLSKIFNASLCAS